MLNIPSKYFDFSVLIQCRQWNSRAVKKCCIFFWNCQVCLQILAQSVYVWTIAVASTISALTSASILFWLHKTKLHCNFVSCFHVIMNDICDMLLKYLLGNFGVFRKQNCRRIIIFFYNLHRNWLIAVG